MSTYKDEENVNIDEAGEEALTEAEAPGEVLDPLAEPVGTRGTQRKGGSEYDEEDARERPAEDGLSPEIPEDANLRVSVVRDFGDELEEASPDRGNSDEISDKRKT